VPADLREARQAAVRAQFDRLGVEALLVTHPPNVRYLTGFTGSSALLLLRPGSTTLVTDFRYATQAPLEAGPSADVVVDQVHVWDRLARHLGAMQVTTLGVEAHVLTLREAERLTAAARCRLVPTSGVVEELRAAKAPAEVAAIRAAAALAQEALAAALPAVEPGQREYEVAARLEHELRRRGSEGHPFPTIVASGPRSALPHARTSARELGRGEWLLLDFGAQVDGYCADLTRTVVVGGRADGRQREVYGVVEEAQRRARAQVRAGMRGVDADALARDVIRGRGFGDAFGHSLGHGLGLEVHEAPRLSPTAEAPLPAGAVVTIEPGIYLPGWGGVRLEDDVHLAPGGPELLSDGRVELVELA